MTFVAEWTVENMRLPVRAISFELLSGENINGLKSKLMVCCANHLDALDVLSDLKLLGERLSINGHRITIESNPNPQYIASFLLEKELIDDVCYRALQRDMQGHIGKYHRKKDKDQDHDRPR